MNWLRIHLAALAFTVKHSAVIYRNELRRTRDGLRF
jgi:hypothetical protein